MIVYEVCGIAAYNGATLRWAGNKKDAKQEEKELIEEYEATHTTITKMEIPTDKKGLLRWLNLHVRYGNDED